VIFDESFHWNKPDYSSELECSALDFCIDKDLNSDNLDRLFEESNK